jgi:hypothetical protein
MHQILVFCHWSNIYLQQKDTNNWTLWLVVLQHKDTPSFDLQQKQTNDHG